MLRIVATSDIVPIMQAAGWNAARIARVLKHGLIHFVRGANNTWDVLVDRDSDDLPPAAVTVLRNQAAVVYVAEFDPYGPAYTVDAQGNQTPNWTVLKGADPGVHRFAGWPC